VTRTALIVLAVLGAAVAAAPAQAAVAHRELSYDALSPPADPNQNALDVYTPDGAAPGDSRPVVVYVHGGGWRVGDKANQISDKVELFTGAGYVFVSVNYRLSPTDPSALDPGRIRFPDHPDDVGEALGWLDRHIAGYGGDPTRLLLIGHSAGAHLIALAATDPRYVERWGIEPWQLIGAVALDSDAYDVADRISELSGNARLTFYNAFGTPEENAATGSWAQGSPINWADAADPRFLIVTQAGAPGRLADNRAMAGALGQDPAQVFAAPYDHEGINDAVGGPNDTAGETAAIMSFVAGAVEVSRTPKARLAERPRKRVERTGRLTAVRFKLAASTPGATFECRVDSNRLRPCARRRTVRLVRGTHRLRYRAIGSRGRPGDSKSYRFRVVARR
jgi:acetyl esterase/lipase